MNSNFFDIFISLREEGRGVAEVIADSFEGKGFLCGLQKSEIGVPGRTENHQVNVRDMINTAKVAVILIGPSGFLNNNKVPGHQADEVRLLAERHLTGTQSDQVKAPILVFVALVSKEDQDKDVDHIQSALDLAAQTTRYDILRHARIGHAIYNFDLPGDEKRRNDINELLRIMRTIIHEEGVVARSQIDYPEASPPAETAWQEPTPRFVPEWTIEDLEIEYLRSAETNWRLGITDRRRVRTAHNTPARNGETPFDFNARRFLVLPATRQASSDPSVSKPVFELLLRHSNKPLLLQGAPGSGKSTTLAMTAAFLAQSFISTNGTKDELFSNTGLKLSELKRQVGGQNFLPVTLKADQITSFGDRSVVNAITCAVARKLYRKNLSEDQADHFERLVRDRMRSQPYAILIDGLDEIFDEDQVQRVLASVEDLWDEYRGDDSGIKIIMSHRSARNYEANGLAEVIKLGKLAYEQINQFFKDYALTAGEEADEFERLARARKRSNVGQDEILRTPLFLNVFCWYLIDHSEFEGTQGKLINIVIDHILRSRADSEAGRKLAYTQEELRRFLRALAIANLESRIDWNSFRACHDAFNLAASVSNRDKLTEVEASNLLEYLEVHTGLIVRSDGRKYKFAIPLFAEVLAGEWIHEVQATEKIVHDLKSLSEIKKWDRPLSVVFYELWQSDRIEEAAKITNNILEFARRSAEPSELYDWLWSVLLIVGTAPRESVAEEKGQESEFDLIFFEIAEFIRENMSVWDHQTRNTVYRDFLRLGLRFDVQLTQIATQGLLRRLNINFDLKAGDWARLDVIGCDNLKIATRPVLSCEFMEFVREAREKTSDGQTLDIWHHAPDQYSALNVEDSEKSLDMPWVEHSSEIWERLERNPAAPMVYVNWYEAVAYAKWLTQRRRNDGTIGEDSFFRLATRREWSKVSEFNSGSAPYPWRAERQNPDAGNWRRTRIGQPSIPGLFPAHGPLKLFDLGTNIKSWAWDCLDKGLGEWPPHRMVDDWLATVGASYRSQIHEVEIRAPKPFRAPLERRYDLGIRLIFQVRRRAN